MRSLKREDHTNEKGHLLESLDNKERRNVVHAMMLDIIRQNVLVKPLDVQENFVFFFEVECCMHFFM